jgi:hypothetical protein
MYVRCRDHWAIWAAERSQKVMVATAEPPSGFWTFTSATSPKMQHRYSSSSSVTFSDRPHMFIDMHVSGQFLVAIGEGAPLKVVPSSWGAMPSSHSLCLRDWVNLPHSTHLTHKASNRGKSSSRTWTAGASIWDPEGALAKSCFERLVWDDAISLPIRPRIMDTIVPQTAHLRRTRWMAKDSRECQLGKLAPVEWVLSGLTLNLYPLSNVMFKLLFLLCFYYGGKSKMLKLLGFTRSRVLALPRLPRRLLGSEKLGNTKGNP